eukprot:TRINITY_DN68759_c0_g1_i1.p1 TRINITY_DN68759_c0_g1~~TRINITY_DN68759_c0_g1_i1.p1  ORF type:complete len:101 (+),score=11.57 TRINITY_DN68759_c0_g1_i1:111-413(+)
MLKNILRTDVVQQLRQSPPTALTSTVRNFFQRNHVLSISSSRAAMKVQRNTQIQGHENCIDKALDVGCTAARGSESRVMQGFRTAARSQKQRLREVSPQK